MIVSKKKGQARILEALISVAIIITGEIMLVGFYQSIGYNEPSSLKQEAHKITDAIRNRGAIQSITSNTTGWENELETLIWTIIPPGVYFNLTVTSTSTKGLLNRGPISNLKGVSQEQFQQFYTLRESYTLSIPVQLSRKVRVPVDVMLVVDKSGSMDEMMPGEGESKEKIEWLKDALNAFLSSSVFNSTTDAIGLVAFSDNAWNGTNYGGRYGYPLTHNFVDVRSKVNTLSAVGGTYGGLGMLYGTKQLNGTWPSPYCPHDQDAIQVIIFLTDGMVNIKAMNSSRPGDPTSQNIIYCGTDDDGNSPLYVSSYGSDGYANWRSYSGGGSLYYGGRGYALMVARDAARQGIRIYTIGFGTNQTWFDPNFLKKVATERYYYAATGSQLIDIFQQIAEEISAEYYVDTDFIIVNLMLARV